MTKISDVRLSEALGFEINTASHEPFRDLFCSILGTDLQPFLRAHRIDLFAALTFALAIAALICF